MILKSEADNSPGRGQGRKFAAAHGRPDLGHGFVSAATALGGLVLSVSSAGTLKVGDPAVVVLPANVP